MRPSAFTIFFIAISTTWGASSVPDNGALAISMRDQSRPPSYSSRPPSSQEDSRPPPHADSVSNRRLLPPIHLPSDLSLDDLPPQAPLEHMEEIWKNRDEKSGLTGGILSRVYRMKQSRPYTGARILMRKRRVLGPKGYEALFREVVYLKELYNFVEWAMEDHRIAVCPRAYIASFDQDYVSGKDTGLKSKELTHLVEVAQASYRQRGYMVDTNPNNYVYRHIGNGRYVAEFI